MQMCASTPSVCLEAACLPRARVTSNSGPVLSHLVLQLQREGSSDRIPDTEQVGNDLAVCMGHSIEDLATCQ